MHCPGEQGPLSGTQTEIIHDVTVSLPVSPGRVLLRTTRYHRDAPASGPLPSAPGQAQYGLKFSGSDRDSGRLGAERALRALAPGRAARALFDSMAPRRPGPGAKFFFEDSEAVLTFTSNLLNDETTQTARDPPGRGAGVHQSQLSSRAARGPGRRVTVTVVFAKPPQAAYSVHASLW
jgi:hypothetical protein